MDEITYMPQWVYKFGNFDVTLNALPLVNTWMIMGVLILFGFLATRQTRLLPNPLQSVAELIVGTFDNMVKDALDIEDYRKYLPLICGLFLFLWLSNMWGVIPYLSEPTKDLNTPLSLGIPGFYHRPLFRHPGQGLQELHQPVFRTVCFYASPQPHWRNCQGRVHLLPVVRQHHGWEHYHHRCRAPDLQPGAAALSERLFRRFLWERSRPLFSPC